MEHGDSVRLSNAAVAVGASVRTADGGELRGAHPRVVARPVESDLDAGGLGLARVAVGDTVRAADRRELGGADELWLAAGHAAAGSEQGRRGDERQEGSELGEEAGGSGREVHGRLRRLGF